MNGTENGTRGYLFWSKVICHLLFACPLKIMREGRNEDIKKNSFYGSDTVSVVKLLREKNVWIKFALLLLIWVLFERTRRI